MEVTHVSNGHGWELAIRCCRDEAAFVPERRPLLVLPGYGMNSSLFSYHPTGLSLMDYLASRGFEVWTVDFRNQGQARSTGGDREYDLAAIATEDVPVTIDHVLEHTRCEDRRVDLVGCSLGGTYIFAYLALHGAASVGSVVAVGSPLRWDSVHPLVRVAFHSTWLAERLQFSYTRAMASVVFPWLLKVPKLLEIYLHPDHVDTSDVKTLVSIVEDPNPLLNRDLSIWIKNRDLVLNGVNVTEAMHAIETPLLTVLANADGIVPEATARSCHEHFAARRKDILRVGDDHIRFAHADLFISDYAQDRIFEPMANWLSKM